MPRTFSERVTQPQSHGDLVRGGRRGGQAADDRAECQAVLRDVLVLRLQVANQRHAAVELALAVSRVRHAKRKAWERISVMARLHARVSFLGRDVDGSWGGACVSNGFAGRRFVRAMGQKSFRFVRRLPLSAAA
jgi:hypothetical protein